MLQATKRRANTWADDVYNREPGAGVQRSFNTQANPNETFDSVSNRTPSNTRPAGDDCVCSDQKPQPSRLTALKAQFETLLTLCLAEKTWRHFVDARSAVSLTVTIKIRTRDSTHRTLWTLTTSTVIPILHLLHLKTSIPALLRRGKILPWIAR
jgi:hypothetical protein